MDGKRGQRKYLHGIPPIGLIVVPNKVQQFMSPIKYK